VKCWRSHDAPNLALARVREAEAVTTGSLFTGIAGFDEGLRRAGFTTLWMAEKEPFCRAVLRTHFPGVQIFNDVADITRDSAEAVDVLTAGFPCQDLSVAGKRAGLEGSRSGLFWEVVRILGELRPPWFVLENVPGLFSSGEGRDFAIVLNALDELGYGLAWRVLDSQFFGVAQRRRRVFIVGCFGKPCPEEILFESEGGAGDIAEGREPGTDVAGSLASGPHVSGFNGQDAYTNHIVAGPLQSGFSERGHGRAGVNQQAVEQGHIVAHTLSAANGIKQCGGRRREDDFNLAVCNALGAAQGGPDDNSAQGGPIVIQDVRGGTRDKTDSGQGIGIREGGPSYTLSVTEQHAVAFESRFVRNGRGAPDTIVPPLKAESGQTGKGDGCPLVAGDVGTPSDSNGMRDSAEFSKGMDSARYRALGNAVTVSVAEWIGRRIIEAERCEVTA
jgi:DNA (cytosine-5)-methyltransferase 1